MATTLTVYDESAGGNRSDPIVLEFLTERITVRELIRQRVYQEVRDYNLKLVQAEQPVFNGLVQPTDAEETPSGRNPSSKKQIDWNRQFEKAMEAFKSNRVLVMVDDRQMESAEDELTITPETRVSFFKLVLLVGG